MKKILILILIISLLFIILSKEDNKDNEVKGVFISYIDYAFLKNKDKNSITKEIDKMIDNISSLGLNTIILQVSAFNDAIYKSDIYLSSSKIVEKEGDPLKIDILDYFIKRSKEKEISIYAWINPFRIRNTNDLELNKNAYYYKWIGTDKIEISDSGIFLNPSDDEVINYITLAIKELCENYGISGLIFDDYYYPSKTIDLSNYEKTDKSISLKQYRYNNISNLIEKSYKTVKSVSNNILFGISPSGNIENNLEEEYLDIEYIINKKYVDFVIPQLYYGFENTNKPYLEVLEKWNSFNCNLYIGLSLYKSGTIDKYALEGKNEWLNNSDIIKRQIISAREKENYKGFFIYRYENLLSNKNEVLKKEVLNLKSITVK